MKSTSIHKVRYAGYRGVKLTNIHTFENVLVQEHYFNSMYVSCRHNLIFISTIPSLPYVLFHDESKSGVYPFTPHSQALECLLFLLLYPLTACGTHYKAPAAHTYTQMRTL